MKPQRLTVSTAREMEFEDLIAVSDGILEVYDAPEGIETPEEEMSRLSRTIDQTPDIYRWFLSLQSYFDHWTDREAATGGMGKSSFEYKAMRERRDAMERMASAAKRRYEGASRLITIRENFDPTGMPRARGNGQ